MIIQGKSQLMNIVNHFLFRLEKEYTTIKNKEMEEQIEIKVCVFQTYKCDVVSDSCNCRRCVFPEVTHRKPAVEAED